MRSLFVNLLLLLIFFSCSENTNLKTDIDNIDESNFIITDYGNLSKNKNQLIEKLERFKISYVSTPAENWLDCSRIKHHKRSTTELQEVFRQCCVKYVYTLLDGEYEFIEAEILETSELISKSIKESNLPKEIRIGAIVRKKEVIIPKSDFVFEKKDLVVFLTKREHLEKVESLFRISSLI